MQPHEHISPQPVFWHSDDYTEVRTDGVVYFLTRNQAAVVRIMYTEHLRGLQEVEGWWLLRKIECCCRRMGEVFRHSPAWKRLIVPGLTKGNYYLAPFGKTPSFTTNSPLNYKTLGKTTKTKCIILETNGVPVEHILYPPSRPAVSKEANGYQQLPLPRPTHHAPCSVDKVDLLAQRLARGEDLWHPEDFVPRKPVLIDRYVFNGRAVPTKGKAGASYIVTELLPSSPRLRPGLSTLGLFIDD
jgi:hypothetical protein